MAWRMDGMDDGRVEEGRWRDKTRQEEGQIADIGEEVRAISGVVLYGEAVV